MDEPLKLSNEIRMGLQFLHQGDYYQAHEYFEDAWRQTMDDSREFYRALLHISGGFYRLVQDRPNAALKFFSRALYWLDHFPKKHLGFDLVSIKYFLENLQKKIENGIPCEIILESAQSMIDAIISSNQTGPL